MKNCLKTQWALWILLVLIVLAGVITDQLSSTKLVALQLDPKSSATVELFRPLPHKLGMTLRFKRNNWDENRLELGDYKAKRGTLEKMGLLEFSNPGVPIKLRVRVGDSEVLYEALPAGAYDATSKWRDLVPFIDDGSPNRFQWPPNHSLYPVLHPGYSKVEISAFEVGPELIGEQVTLVIESPSTFKGTAPGYGFFWWFMFWPLYAFLLIIYGVILLSLSIRSNKSVLGNT